MTIILPRTVAIALLVVRAGTVLAHDQPQRQSDIRPDATFQAAFAELANASHEAAFTRQLTHIDRTSGPDRRALIAQLLWYAAARGADAKSNALVGRVLKRLDLPRHALVAALVPHLDDTNQNVRDFTRNLLRGFEDRSASRPPEFSAYRAIVEADVRAGREPQRSLVEFMYDSDPGTALLTMMRAFQLRDPDQIKPILWAEHVVSDLLWRRRFGFADRTAVDPAAAEQLDKLSRHADWWARLYVAQIASMHRELAVPALIARLAADPNVLVRQAIERAAASPARR